MSGRSLQTGRFPEEAVLPGPVESKVTKEQRLALARLAEVASFEDLVAMKLSAIGGRGAAKDFWDLDAMLAAGVCGGTLTGALDAFRRKFPNIDPSHVVRALTYFGEANAVPLPGGLTSERWEAMQRRSVDRVRSLMRSGV